MANVLVEESSLSAIADSIRAKNGTANTYKPAEMSGAIDALPTGGGTMQSKSVSYTPTETAQSRTVTPDTGYDGLSSVSVSVGAIDDEYVGSGITRRSVADLDLTGATFTAPAGYYASDADKTMMTGHMSVSATKGTVSNHSVAVTPKAAVDNAGYFATGDRTGTAVSVSASELVSGTKSITQNGTGIDVTEYAAIDVAVPSGSPTLQNKTVHPSASDQSVTADAGYDGLGTVSVKKVTTSNLTADNIVSGVTVEVGDVDDSDRILSVTGTASGGDPDENLVKYIEGTLDTINCDATAIRSPIRNNSYIKHIFLPLCTTLTSDCFFTLANLLDIVLPAVTTIPSNGRCIYGCTKMTAADVGSPNRIAGQLFSGCSVFKTLVIRKSTVATLENINAFTNSPFASGKAGGTLYVPNNLIASYQAASNWSTILGYTNNSIKSIESTHTDPTAPIDLTLYYVDGTPIPT